MSTVYVRFNVVVQDAQYSYHATRTGEADIKFEALRDVLDELDTNSFLKVMLSTALAEYDASEIEIEEAKNDQVTD